MMVEKKEKCLSLSLNANLYCTTNLQMRSENYMLVKKKVQQWRKKLAVTANG